MKIAPFTFGTQNLTEGQLSPAMERCSAAVYQEVNKNLMREECGLLGLECFIPKRDPRQALVWDPDWLDMKSTGWTRFHRSGTAEDWPFKTPARGMIWGRGRLTRQPDIKIAIFGVWFLNSWEPQQEDAFTHLRRRIVQDTSLPVVRDKIREWQRHDYLVLGGGDPNSMSWPGYIGKGLEQPWKRGLDRIWYDEKFFLISKREGPKVGVGDDMKHHSKIVKLKVG